MARKSKITDKDHGYARLFERIHRMASGVHVDVGVLGADAAKLHRPEITKDERKERKILNANHKRGVFFTKKNQERRDALNNKAKSSITIGEIGEIHEYGLGNNPVRSWLRGYITVYRQQIAARVKRAAAAVLQGKLNEEQAMDLLGFSIAGGIKKRIAQGIAPQVTAATQRRKGPTKTIPLINSGQFRSSISHKVATGL